MEQYNLENNLRKISTEDTAISSLVRTRLDETYASIASGKAVPHERKTASRKRRLISITAAASLLGATVFASGFVSPAMASSIKSIPVIGSIFSSIERDIGLRNAGNLGLTSPTDTSITHGDVTLQVKETIFDGSRAAFVLHVAAPNLKNGQYHNGKKLVKLSQAVDNVYLTVNGKRQGDPGSILGGLFYGGAGEAHPDTLVFEEVLDPSAAMAQLDSFEAEVTISFEGIDQEFKLSIPFQRTTANMVQVQPGAVTANEEFTFTVQDIQVTPVTTRLNMSLSMNKASTLGEKEERRLRRIGVALFDDQGRQLPVLNGDGVYEGNRLDRNFRFATTAGATSYLMVKPFVIKDDFAENVEEGQYLKELEVKIDLP